MKEELIFKYTVTVGNKKYDYSIKPISKKIAYFECEAADIGQEILVEDIPGLLFDLPNLIIAEKEYQKKQSEMIRFRISAEDKRTIEKKAIKAGYPTISAFLRALALGS